VFIPLVDILRCVQPHAETWLVASIDRAEDRDIVEGTLGCPTCLAEYPIHAGVVFFSACVSRTFAAGEDEAEAIRLAAALDLTEARMIGVLHGSWAAHAPLIASMSPAHLLLLNASAEMLSGDGVSVLVSETAPLACGSVDAIAIDQALSEQMFASLRRSLRGGGRLLAPVALPVPSGFTELARDRDVWVARLDDSATVSAPVPLTRRTS
jgi:hypothetical protein